MNAQRLFATLVVCQAAHSIEEATFGLYELLPYFTWIDTPIPGGARVAFIVGNAAFVLFGGWCYFARVKPGAPSAGGWVMLWVVIEIFNGVLHPSWSLTAGEYIPGTGTAPVLLLVALWLLWRWTHEERALEAPY